MANYEEELEKYVQDSRIACKYGIKCYQMNSHHHQKYKHPPKRRAPNEMDKDRNIKKVKGVNTDGDNTQKINEKSNNDFTGGFKPVSTTSAATIITEERKESAQNKQDIISHRLEKPEDMMETDSEHAKEETQSPNFDGKLFIKKMFLVDMPDDFYLFYEFCTNLNEKNPLQAFGDFDLLLVGPFDVLAHKFSHAEEKRPEEYLIHWRYYYDPPEFQTVLKGDNKRGYHIGYFRDSPDENPVFVASNCAAIDGVLNVMGNNIFAAVYLYLEDYKKTGDPFKKIKVTNLQVAIKAKAEKLKLPLTAKPASVTSRDKKVLTRTFNRAGLVVPYNKRTQVGYRALALSNKELHSLLNKLKTCLPEQQKEHLSDLQPVVTYASIALDECDFGTGLELGWNLFFYGIESLNGTTLRFLRDSYNLLHRDVFAKIAESHLSNRRKGCNLSIL